VYKTSYGEIVKGTSCKFVLFNVYYKIQ